MVTEVANARALAAAMGDAGFFKGTSLDQDTRFSNKQRKLEKSMKFPPEFKEKVSTKKVEMATIQKWITEKVTELMGIEDEMLIMYIFNMLEEENPDPKNMQIQLTSFLEKKTPAFMEELWKMLISAQSNPTGIPTILLERKKEELRQRAEKARLEEEKRMAEEAEVMRKVREVSEKHAEEHRRARQARDGRDERDRHSRHERRRSSPPRRREKYRSPHRRREHYRSPPRRRENYYSPPRRRDDYYSPPRRHDDYYSPPRRDRDDRGSGRPEKSTAS